MSNIFENFFDQAVLLVSLCFSILWPNKPISYPESCWILFPSYVILIKIRFVINKIYYSTVNNLVLDIHLFVSAQEELSKTGLLFKSYDNIFAKIKSSEIEELIEKQIV